jgi:hypothetical protein
LKSAGGSPPKIWQLNFLKNAQGNSPNFFSKKYTFHKEIWPRSKKSAKVLENFRENAICTKENALQTPILTKNF